MRSPQKQSADQGVRNGVFLEAIIALDEVDENLALYLLNLIPARRAASDTFRCTSRGSRARWVRLRNGRSPSTFGHTDVMEYQDPNTSVRTHSLESLHNSRRARYQRLPSHPSQI